MSKIYWLFPAPAKTVANSLLCATPSISGGPVQSLVREDTLLSIIPSCGTLMGSLLSAFCFLFSVFLLFCFLLSAFLLFCFSAFLLFCFPAFLLFCFSAFLFFVCCSAFLLFCFSAFLPFCFSSVSSALQVWFPGCSLWCHCTVITLKLNLCSPSLRCSCLNLNLLPRLVIAESKIFHS